MSTTTHTVHVRVNDAATGQSTPVRIRFTGPDGEYLAPFGRLTDFATGCGEDVGGNLRLGDANYAYIDGSCEIGLPSGPLTVEISKGPEYTPLRRELMLSPGKLALRFTMERWTNLRQEGWYSGDTRAHFLSPHAALVEAAAEDLAVVNLLALQTSRSDREAGPSAAIPNILAFSGQQPALQVPGHLVVVNTYNRHPVLGNLGLLNCHRVVYPLLFGEPDGFDNWTLADWCDQCHRKGGLVVWTEEASAPAGPRGGEGLADLILGKVDAYEIDGSPEPAPGVAPDWYLLWSCGCHVPLVGASAKDSNARALGQTRTYARLQPGEEFTYKNWIEAIRSSRTFVTNGPLLSLTVGGQDPGAVLDVTAGRDVVQVRAEARSLLPLEHLELICNGSVVASTAAIGSPASALLETAWPMEVGGWLAVRCWGGDRRSVSKSVGTISSFAHTSPVWVKGPSRSPTDAAAVASLTSRLEGTVEWAHSQGRYENEQQRQRLVGILERAREELVQRQASTF